MEGLSGHAFLFLSTSKLLSLRAWLPYVPKRGQADDSFPCERLVVYSLRLQLPSYAASLAAPLALAPRALAAGHAPWQLGAQGQEESALDAGAVVV